MAIKGVNDSPVIDDPDADAIWHPLLLVPDKASDGVKRNPVEDNPLLDIVFYLLSFHFLMP